MIDVRELQEYGKGHLPGSIRVPVDELPHRLDDLDSTKTTIICCSHGLLSRAAAQVLLKAGFLDVRVLQGGMHAWHNGMSSGLPGQFSGHFDDAGSAQEKAIISWQVEEMTRQFYEEMASSLGDPEVAGLFAELAEAESQHKATLKALWEALAGRAAGDDFPEMLQIDKEIMEGVGTSVKRLPGLHKAQLPKFSILPWPSSSMPTTNTFTCSAMPKIPTVEDFSKL